MIYVRHDPTHEHVYDLFDTIKELAWKSQRLLHKEVIWPVWLPGDRGPQKPGCIILLSLPVYVSIHLK